MKVIVTGGAGFIGSSVCEALINRGDQVLCLDNFDPNSYQIGAKLNNIHDLRNHPNFTLLYDSVESKNISSQIEEAYDVLIHLAAKAGVRNSLLYPFEYYSTNVNGTVNILWESKKLGVKKVIFASSSSVYGNIPESCSISEDHHLSPISPYAQTKMIGEMCCKDFANTEKIPTIALRFFSVYGKRQRPDLLFNKLVQSTDSGKPFLMYGDGSSMRDYTHVSDIVNGILQAIKYSQDDLFETFNLGSGNPQSLNSIIDLYESITHSNLTVENIGNQEGDVNFTFANIDSAKVKLKYKPMISIQSGLMDFIISR